MADQPLPPGQEWKGSHTVAKDSRWLCAEDLLARDTREVAVEIEKVLRRDNVTMQEGRKMKVALSLKFKGKQKELLLNATNRKTLAALFDTSDCGQWYGKRIMLYVKDDVRYPDGTRGPALRIRSRRLPQGKDANDVVFNALQNDPLPSDQTQRNTLLDAIYVEQMNADMDDAALWAKAGVDSSEDLVKLPMDKLSALLKELAP